MTTRIRTAGLAETAETAEPHWGVPSDYHEFVENLAMLPELVPPGRHSMGIGLSRADSPIPRRLVRLFHLAEGSDPDYHRFDHEMLTGWATRWWWDFFLDPQGFATIVNVNDADRVTPADLCAVYAAFAWADTPEGVEVMSQLTDEMYE